MIFLSIPLLAMVVFLGGASPAQAALELPRVLHSVDAHYPLVRAATEDLLRAEGDLLSAKGGFDPVVRSGFQATPSGEYENRVFDSSIEQPTALWGARLQAGYRNGQGKFGPYDERLLTNSDGELRAGVEVPLLRGGLIDDRRARIGVAEKGMEATRSQLGVQKLDARRLASHRYFDWVASGVKLRVAETLLKLAVDRDQVLKSRVSSGDAARVDQVDNRRSVVQREAAVIQAKRSFEKASLELSLFLRNDQGQVLLPALIEVPNEGLPIPRQGDFQSRLSSPIDSVVEQHPEVLRLRANLEQVEVERSLARNSILPKLDGELAVSQDLGTGIEKKTTFEYKAALKLEIPLLLRSGRGRFASVTAQEARVQAQLGLARDRLRVGIDDSNQAIQASFRRFTMAQEEAELALKVEEAERVRFRHGDSNILMVNLREQATADARVRMIDASADYHRAVADFEAVTAAQPSSGG
jgi:cobalt-zinc-cadmium efflux system outer membrane protein